MVSDSVVEDVVAEQNGVGLTYGPTSGITTGNTIRDSVFRDNTGAGISLDYPAEGIAVERCQVTGNGDGLVAFDSGRFDSAANRITDCDFSENTGAGLSIEEGHFSEISNSTIRGNGGDGLYHLDEPHQHHRQPGREQRRHRRERGRPVLEHDHRELDHRQRPRGSRRTPISGSRSGTTC